jgi:crotonobetainyl-CoA:carnitine CoA-transferase CaiB-like acyl-CoA transferase
MPNVLENIRIVTLAPNVPGPVAAARLRDLGASVTKVEAPGGDLLEGAAPAWYAELHEGIATVIADLSTVAGRAALDLQLAGADVFITSMRHAALAKFGLIWETLHQRFPNLISVAIVGEEDPHDDRPGHDLTYLAQAGLVDPQSLPRTLFVDLVGAERAVCAVLAALYTRARTHEATHTRVSLAASARALAEPLKYGLTGDGALLGGAFAGYNTYKCRDGYVALAALETHFFERICDAVLESGDFATLGEAFASRTCAQWETTARQLDIPLVALPNART